MLGKERVRRAGQWEPTRQHLPVAVASITDAAAIAGGYDHSCAVLKTGHVQCWGRNDQGELGNGATTSSSTPVEVSGITDAVAIAGGIEASCAVLRTGAVRCWGWAPLGDGTSNSSSTPDRSPEFPMQ